MIKLFKLFETRTAGLGEEEFRELLQKNCRDYINNPILLQRNKWRNDGDYSYINPIVNTRTAYRDLDNGVFSEHNSLLMDNLPSWKSFPKRNKSLIGITNEDPRDIFGKFRYLIIPYDNAKFGVAPSMDIWSCTTKISEIDPLDFYHLQSISFNDKLSQAFASNAISDKSYSEMISDIEEKYNEWLISNNSIFQNIFKYIKENNLSVEDGFDKLLSPDKFSGTLLDDLDSFKVMNYDSLSMNCDNFDNYEFWTESKCLLYRIDIESSYDYDIVRNNIREAFKKFCKEYL